MDPRTVNDVLARLDVLHKQAVAWNDDESKTYPISRALTNSATMPTLGAVGGGAVGAALGHDLKSRAILGGIGALAGGTLGLVPAAVTAIGRNTMKRGMQGRINQGGDALTESEKEMLLSAAERLGQKKEASFDDHLDYRAIEILAENGYLT